MPNAFLTNWHADMPWRKKVRLLFRNNWIKVRKHQTCCGHPGEPGERRHPVPRFRGTRSRYLFRKQLKTIGDFVSGRGIVLENKSMTD